MRNNFFSWVNLLGLIKWKERNDFFEYAFCFSFPFRISYEKVGKTAPAFEKRKLSLLMEKKIENIKLEHTKKTLFHCKAVRIIFRGQMIKIFNAKDFIFSLIFVIPFP